MEKSTTMTTAISFSEDGKFYEMDAIDPQDEMVLKFSYLYKMGFPVLKPVGFKMYKDENRMVFRFEIPNGGVDFSKDVNDHDIKKFFKKFNKRKVPLSSSIFNNDNTNGDGNHHLAVVGTILKDCLIKTKNGGQKVYLVPARGEDVRIGDFEDSLISYYLTLLEECGLATDAVKFLDGAIRDKEYIRKVWQENGKICTMQKM